MTFQQAIRSGFQNYTNFRDRSTRSEYWYWALFALLANIVAGIADSAVGSVGIVSLAVGLAILLPGLAVSVRRMHDIGKSGWHLLWVLVPLLGVIYLIYLFVQQSQGPNQYGTAPLQPLPA